MQSIRIAIATLVIAATLGASSIARGQDLVARLVDTAGSPGGSVNVQMVIDNQTAGPIQGFSFSFRNVNADLIPQSVAGGVDLAALNGGSGPDFLNVSIFPDPGPEGTGIGCGTVFSFLGTDALDPGVGLHCLDMEWAVAADATPGDSTTVDFCDCFGSPPLFSLVVIGGMSITPSFDPATVEFSDDSAFIRGDPNGSGALDLADPIYTLDHLFQAGPIICRDAMDANADSAIDLADVLYLLDAINGFGPLPPAPFPSCGHSSGGLGCEQSAACGE